VAHPAASSDVLIVGGGPAGTSAAIELARAGRLVTIVERRAGAPKPCGGLLTPRAVTALADLHVDLPREAHRVDHVRFTYQTNGEHRSGTGADLPSTSVRWPDDVASADHGVVVPRQLLDQHLLDQATSLGVQVLDAHTATAPIVERGFVRGAHVNDSHGTSFEFRASYLIVADGANSRFGRALGTFRRPSWPHAVALKTTDRSGLHDAREIELVFGLRDRAGTPVTGYGFMFPRGDGTINVGVVVMSTSPSFQVINLPHLLGQLEIDFADRWCLDRTTGAPTANVGGRIPMGGSVGPQAGPTFLVVGDAAGAANPLTGAGIEYAIETGMMAGDVVAEALAGGSATALQRYPKAVEDRYGSYFKVGRLTTRLLGNPALHRRVSRSVASNATAAEAYLRLGSNQLRTGSLGPAEFAYRAGRAISLVAPDS
jgi:geranylgeranyl reductase family protein